MTSLIYGRVGGSIVEDGRLDDMIPVIGTQALPEASMGRTFTDCGTVS